MLKYTTLFAAILFCVSTFADNFAPPFYVGQPGTYHAEWDFGNSGDLSNPDSESDGGPLQTNYFLYDQFSTHIDYDGPGWGWDPADGDGGITKPGGGSFGINTINWVDEVSLKLIRIQLTFSGPAPDVTHAQGFSFDLYHGGGATTTDHGLFPADPPVSVDPNHTYWDITMHPNPDWEQIVVNVPQGTVIDQIVVDTWSTIPEPSAMTALTLGGFLIFRRRR